MKRRQFNKRLAQALGYFGLPCPLCGQEFGGHEWEAYIDGKVGSIPTDKPGISQGICPDCTEGGRGIENHPPVRFV
jgi:hypothetical protein